METTYRIRCRHCGTLLPQNADSNLGAIARCANSDCHIDTEFAMRCPVCMKRLNRTEQEFKEQIEMVLVWN